MSQNPGKDAEIALTVFSGFVSNMDPIALPQGASPDCSDMTFLPGGGTSRPAFQRIFAASIYPNHTQVYGKSFVDQKGVIRNLYLYSNGGMTVEFPAVAPGVETALLDNDGNPVMLPAGSYMKSITAFGREWLAPADGLHGTDIPLQYDGTYLDRVTQDGPGSSPSVISLALPAVSTLNAVAPSPTLAITGLFPDQKAGNAYWTTLNIYVSGDASGIALNQSVTISGTGTAYDGQSFPVILNPGPGGAVTVAAILPLSSFSGAVAGTLTIGTGVANTVLSRTNNIVTALTQTPHQLRPGYQAQMAGFAAAVIGGGIASIVINNENNPGVATVTTNFPHGLVPGQDTNVSIAGVEAISLGAISTITRAGGTVTVVLAASGPVNLTPGAFVTVAGVGTTSFDTIAQVLTVTATAYPGDTFTYAQTDADANDASGTVAINWPIPNAATPTLYNVIAAPTPTTFQVPIDYADGTWTTGSVSYAWDGKFYVQTVPTPTSFTYQQYGPNDTALYVAGQTVTPYGQAAPGEHQMQVFFITRKGYTTAPSPPVKFIANGGQYISVSNIPIGPPNVVARAIAFTGAEGAYFFYIPAPPQENGQLVGTATQINDNVTTSDVFDFGDPTLFAALGISISGNNLANQVVVDGALGFGFYSSRLFTYGQRNIIDNLLNMGFDGGYLPSSPTLPTGWTAGDAYGQLSSAGHYGSAWQINAGTRGNFGLLSQPFYEDYSGAPIATANEPYSLRCWVKASVLAAALQLVVSISNASTGFSSLAVISSAAMTTTGAFVQVNFSQPMPSVIPADMTLSVYAVGGVTASILLVDEISIIYANSPYLEGMFASYANNPEGMDGVSGVIGPEDDTHQVMDLGIIRDYLYMLTRDPSGRLHQTSQGLTEPADWVVSEVAANCGTVSAYSSIRSQADDSSAAGGEEFWGWYSSSGIRLFGGQEPFKISQEIQRPIGQQFPGAPADLGALNTAAQLAVWGLNDPQSKTMWWGIPTGNATAPTVIYALSYLGLDSAEQIASSPPIHRSLSGTMVANDLARKWSPWQRTMNGAALMFRNGTDIQPVFFAGNGSAPAAAGGGHSNAYVLNPNQYTDDDYGLISPYYITAAFPDKMQEQSLQLGGGFKMASYLRAMFYGVGFMNISILYNFLNNEWPLNGQYLMSLTPLRGAPWPCAQATGDLVFVKFASTPNPQGGTAKPLTDNQFSLSRLSVWMRKNARFPDPGVWP